MTSRGQEIAEHLDRVSQLIREVGAAYEMARRYRGLDSVCEERYLAPALEVASTLRRIARADTFDRELFERQVARLRQLHADCVAAIEGVRASDRYRHARAAWREGRVGALLQALPDIFAWIVPEQPTAPLYHPMSLRGSRADGEEHFLPASACADQVAALARDGIPADSAEHGLGTDGELRAVRLADAPRAFDTPIALRIEPAALDATAVCRLSPTGDFLVYVPCLRTRFEVLCAQTATDEWWAVRPDAYAGYLRELQEALAASGIPYRTEI